MNKVYVYINYCDEDAFGERIVKVFATKNDAMTALKKDVESAYQLPWNEIPDEIMLSDDDTFEEDYVSIDNGDGAVHYWIIEEQEVICG